MNEFALPRAIVDFERHSFVAWNVSFLKKTGYVEDEIKSAKLEEFLILGESWVAFSDEKKGQTIEYTASAAKRALGADPVAGYVVRSQSKIGYVMLDVFDSPSLQFDQGRITGREEERNRIVKAYHEEVSSSMIAALFLIESAKSELEEADLPQVEAVTKASDMLTKATEKIAHVLSNAVGTSP